MPNFRITDEQMDASDARFESLTPAARGVVGALSEVLTNKGISPTVDTLDALNFLAQHCQLYVDNAALDKLTRDGVETGIYGN